MEAVSGIESGLGGIAKKARQIRSQVSDCDPQSLCQPTDSFRAGAALFPLDEAQKWPGNASLLADFIPRETLCVDVFGDIHAQLLHYVNFSSKGHFT
jgi:hypothetical protein